MNQQDQNAFLLSTFREEIDGHTVTLTRELVELEESGAAPGQAEHLREIMRVLHTIKGAARMMGFGPTTKIAHAMEEVFGYYRECTPPEEVPRATIDQMFEGLDAITELTREATRQAGPEAEPNPLTRPEYLSALTARISQTASALRPADDAPQSSNCYTDNHNGTNGYNLASNTSASTAELIYHASDTPAFPALPVIEPVQAQDSRPDRPGEETIRVRLDKLDDLINLAGELVINKQQNEEHLGVLQELLRQSRQRSRMAQQLRDYIIERTPVEERNRLLGITELFSFEQPQMPDWVRQEGAAQSNSLGASNSNGTGNGNGAKHSSAPALAQANSPSTYWDGFLGGSGRTAADDVFGLDARGLRKVFGKLEEMIELDGGLETRLAGVVRERKAFNLRFGSAADELRRNMLGIRMLPLDTIFGRFVRPVRDLAAERGKEVRLVVAGGAIEVDKRILEQIVDPLVHMLRNAVDHGIEPAATRLIVGKSLEGTLRLTASQKGSHVLIQVSDDGGGIDPKAIRRTAIERGYMDEQTAAALSDEAVLDLIYRPGFSTRARPDEISGRGIGMDVVQQNIKRLNGRVLVQSTLGQGTTFNLEIPLTLATVDALIIRAAGQLFALPSVMVAGLTNRAYSELQTVEGRPVIRSRGQLVPVLKLAEVLNLSPLVDEDDDDERGRPEVLSELERETSHFQGILLSTGSGSGPGHEAAERFICFEVDALVDEREVVVKGLGSFLDKTPNIAGVTVLGADGLALILDVFGLVQNVRLGQIRAGESLPHPLQTAESPRLVARRQSRILVVDDSLATRELERSILETAGFKVDTARDGVEALKLCHDRRPDLVLSDVEMPNMDGFRLSAAIRQDEHLRDLPIIIVSSRDSDEDRRKATGAGAQAYIVKGQFEQNKLLETISRLIV